MIEQAIILSLQITCIYQLFQQGMLLGWFRIEVANVLDGKLGLKASLYVQKPVWDCLICMASLWTCILTFSFDLKLMLVVCGINTLIDKLLSYERIADS